MAELDRRRTVRSYFDIAPTGPLRVGRIGAPTAGLIFVSRSDDGKPDGVTVAIDGTTTVRAAARTLTHARAARRRSVCGRSTSRCRSLSRRAAPLPSPASRSGWTRRSGQASSTGSSRPAASVRTRLPPRPAQLAHRSSRVGAPVTSHSGGRRRAGRAAPHGREPRIPFTGGNGPLPWPHGAGRRVKSGHERGASMRGCQGARPAAQTHGSPDPPHDVDGSQSNTSELRTARVACCPGLLVEPCGPGRGDRCSARAFTKRDVPRRSAI